MVMPLFMTAPNGGLSMTPPLSPTIEILPPRRAAINYPARRDLAVALTRLLGAGWGIDGASDHGTHEAIYLHDPDFNGIELAWDRAREEWPRVDGTLTFSRKPLDVAGLLGELGDEDGSRHLDYLSNHR